MHIDRIYSQQKETQMMGKEHSTRSLGDSGTLAKYKRLAPTQNRLPTNALVEEVEVGLNNLGLGKQITHLIGFCFNFS